jgi:hypothetical protein
VAAKDTRRQQLCFEEICGDRSDGSSFVPNTNEFGCNGAEHCIPESAGGTDDFL